MEKSYRALNDVLVNLFNDIMDIEQDAIITGEFCDITNNDMHIIEAVGVDKPMNMSSIAKKMLVTMGTLTISMNSLVKKAMYCGNAVRKTGAWYISVSRKRVSAHITTMRLFTEK